MKVAVCEMHPEMMPASEEWLRFADRIRRAEPDLLLLAEMPFGPWVAAAKDPDPARIRRVRELHEHGLARLGELEVPVVLGTRPVEEAGRSVNEAFVWTRGSGLQPAHTKQYFPDEEGFYEARWFEAGERRFSVVQAGPCRVGFLICTDLMFNEHARRYGRRGAQLIAVPRAGGRTSLGRWLVAARMAAIVSGCYVLSSNREGVGSSGVRFGGTGWVIDPAGDTVARTSPASPVVCYDVDLDFVARAQQEYPCYVKE